jgi:hypothetical protein
MITNRAHDHKNSEAKVHMWLNVINAPFLVILSSAGQNFNIYIPVALPLTKSYDNLP